VTLLTLTFVACGGGDDRPLQAVHLRIATGTEGGVYNAYGAALADLVNKYLPPWRASAISTDGSVENLQRLANGSADVAFSVADVVGPALHGHGPFPDPIPIVALARLYDDYMQIVARADPKLKTITDLRGKTVSIGAPRSGTALTAGRILKFRDLRLRGPHGPRILRLGLQQSADALAAGRIDAFFWSGGVPTTAIEQLRHKMLKRKRPVRWLALPPGTAARLDPNLYTDTVVPRSIYGPLGAVSTVVASNLLVVRKDLPEEVAYRLTRLLFDHRPELERAHEEARGLTERGAIATYPLEWHEGAKRWYARNHP
jgi:TRAP transporter TAXI family solute receptor